MGIDGKTTTKSDIKEIKVAQMLLFGTKMVKMDNSWRYDLTRQSNVDLELENASIVFLGLVAWW